MRCIINCSGTSTGWIREFFPGMAEYMLPIANKPYLEYLIDFCVLAGITDIRLVADNPAMNWQEHIGNGERWNVDISYAPISGDMDARELRKRNIGFVAGEDLLVFHGVFALIYDKRNFKMFDIQSGCWQGEITPEGDGYSIFSATAPADTVMKNRYNPDSTASSRVVLMNSVGMFYRRNMEIVYGEGANYNMPGYSNEPNVYIGRNVIIERTADVQQPVIVGDSIQFGRSTQIGPGAVIGNNSLVDERALIIDSVVVGNSYIGENLEISGKIVYQNTIIDPERDFKISVDEMLISTMGGRRRLNCSYKQRFAAIILFLFQLIPFLLLRPFIVLSSSETECFMADAARSRKLKLYQNLPSGNMAGRYFRKLSLDRFHLLPFVIRGQVRLIGNMILVVNAENRRLLEQFPDYSPGLFSLSELLGHADDPGQREMDELYYSYHAGMVYNLKILQRVLLKNLFKKT